MRRRAGRTGAWLPVAVVSLAAVAALAAFALRTAPDAPQPAGEGREAATATPGVGRADRPPEVSGFDLSELPTGDAVTRRDSSRPVAQEATAVLSAYRDQGLCVLVRAGYLDLFGEVWGCVVAGGSWSEVSVVRAAAGGGSEVTAVRMDAALWEESLREELGGVWDGLDDAEGG